MIDSKVPDDPDRRDYLAMENRRRRMNVDMGERLRTLVRKQTLRAFSAEMGFHPQSVRRWLQGDSSPPAAFLIAVCERYRVSADWLLLGIGPPALEERNSSGPVRVVDATIIEKMAKLGELLRELADEAERASSAPSEIESRSGNHRLIER